MTFETLLHRYPPHDTWPPATAYAKDTVHYKQPVCSWGKPPPAVALGGRQYALQCPGKGLRVGDVVCVPTRVGYTVALSFTAAVEIRDVTVHAAGNMAITEFQGDGGNVYTNISLVPRGSRSPNPLTL